MELVKAKRTITTTENKTKVNIPPIDFRTVMITLVGETPLLVHKFSEKSKKEMDDKVQGKAKQKKAPRNPQAEYEASMYKMPGKKNAYGIPASGVKLCAVSACRFTDGMKMTQALGSFHVFEESGGLIQINSLNGKKPAQPTMDERIVRIGNFGNKVPQTRYRGRFDDWSITFKVKYNARTITVEQLLNLYENAGFSVGLCEMRPEKKGNLGMFRVERA